MSAAITAIERIGYSTWKFYFSGTAPYRVYHDGKLLQENPVDGDVLDGATTNNAYLILSHDDAEEPPSIELFDADSTGTPQSLLYPPYVTLQWRGVDYVERYRIDLYTGGAWVAQATVFDDGRGYFRYESGAMADCATHLWRVVAVDQTGNESEPLPYSLLVVRNPPPPSITMTYSSGYLITEAR